MNTWTQEKHERLQKLRIRYSVGRASESDLYELDDLEQQNKVNQWKAKQIVERIKNE